MRLRSICHFFRLVLLCRLLADVDLLRAQDAVLTLTPAPVLSTLAGRGRPGNAGSSATAAAVNLALPSSLAYDSAGNLYLTDTRNHLVRRVNTAGTVSTIAGSGQQGFGGDGGPATSAELDSPLGIAVMADASVYVADSHNQRIRRIAPDGTITTIAGTGVAGFTGDGGPAVQASLRNPAGLAAGLAGELYIADTGNHRVRRLARDGTIRTVAGSGVEAAMGDGGPATAAGLDAPVALAMRNDGALLIADRLNNRIRVVTSDGKIASLPRAALPLRRPSGIAVTPWGDVLIADSRNYRLQQMSAGGTGVVLGSGEQGALDQNAGALQTALGEPNGLAVDAAGGFVVTDRDHSQVQHLALGSLPFPDTPVGLQSGVRQVALRNATLTPLAVSALTLPAGFFQDASSTCGTLPVHLAGKSSCVVSIAFAPAAEGPQSGLLTAQVVGGLPQRVLLSGNGLRSGTALATTTTLKAGGSLNYVGMPLLLTAAVLSSGSLPPTGTITFLDAGVSIGSAPVSSGAAQLSTSSLGVGQHSLTALYSGDVHSAASTSAALAETVALTPDFTWSADSPRLAVQAGSTGTLTLTMQPIQGTLNQTVALKMEGLPQGTATSLSPSPLVIGSNPVSVSFSVTVPAGARITQLVGGIGMLVGVGSFVRRRRMPRLACVATLSGCIGLSGCGGGFLSGPASSTQAASHTYPVTVTATAPGVTGSPLVHTATFTLVVTP